MDVAVVTVGDELLAGDTENTNATWLCRQLTDRGADVRRVTTVPDDVGVIARIVNEQRAEFDAVVTTGGLGPTHDDITMAGVAAAVGREVELNEDAKAWLEADGYAADDLAPGTVSLPAGARMLPNDEGVAPGAVVENVYVLPGVPDEMRRMFERVAGEFGGRKRATAVVEADEPESELVDRLREARDRFGVTVGSYPGDRVRIKLTGTDPEAVDRAAAWLRGRVDGPGPDPDADPDPEAGPSSDSESGSGSGE